MKHVRWSLQVHIILALTLALTFISTDSAMAATYRQHIARLPETPVYTQSVRIWMNSDTVFGETAGVEYKIGSNYIKALGTYNNTTYPGANWYADIPAQPAGTTVEYQLFTRNQEGTDYGFTGFNWSYTVSGLPTTVYVNNMWVGTMPGADPDGAGPATNFGGDAFATIQDGINGVAPGGTVNVAEGTHTLVSQVNINKANITLRGAGSDATIVKVSGTGYRFNISASGVTLEDFQIEKTDKTGLQNIIYLGANNITIRNNLIFGQYVFGDGEVSRAFESPAGISGLLIEGNTIHSLRQPGYLNGSLSSPTTGTIKNNTVYSTRGWVLEGAAPTFEENNWGAGNIFDIVILSVTSASYYPDIMAVSAMNNDAVIEDQRVSPAVLSVAHVNATASSGGNGGQVEPYQTITPAISRVVAGGKIFVESGAYNEALAINKSLTLQRAPGASSQPILNNACTGSLITVSASNVTIDGLSLKVNQGTCTVGIYAATGYNNLVIVNNTIESTSDFTTGMVFESYGIYLSGGGTQNITIQSNMIQPESVMKNAFGRGIRLQGTHGLIGGEGKGNTISAFYTIQAASANGGALEITHNTLNGQNEINTPQSASAHKFEYNACSTGDPGTGAIAGNLFALLEVKNHRASGATLSVARNTFSNHTNFGVFLGRSNNVTVDNNTFTPLALAANTAYRHVHVNTKERTVGSETPAGVSNITITNNIFNGHANASGGTAIEFANHHAGATPAFQNIILGGSGNENVFKSQLGTYLRLDPLAGSSNSIPLWTGLTDTTMAPVAENFGAADNHYAVSGGEKHPTTMAPAELFEIEDKIVHKIDYAALGFVTITPNTVYVTPNSYLPGYTSAASIQRGVDAVASGGVVNVAAGTYNEQVIISKAIDVIGQNKTNTIIDGTGLSITQSGLIRIHNVPSGAIKIDGFTLRNAPLVGNNRFAIYATGCGAGSILHITNNILIGWGVATTNQDWGFYSQNNQANVLFSQNEVNNFKNNSVIFELHTGPAEVSYNTINAYSAPPIFSMSYKTGSNNNDVLAKQHIHHNTLNTNGSSGIVFASAFGAAGYNERTNGKYYDVHITDNTITGPAYYSTGIQLEIDGDYGGFESPVIVRNTITPWPDANYINDVRGIRLLGPVSDAKITDNQITGMTNGIVQQGSWGQTFYATGTEIVGNTIRNSTAKGIRIVGGAATVKGNGIDGNSTVFEIGNAGTLLAYANNITAFTNAGLTTAAGTFNARHNWWGAHSTQPTGVDNDSWRYRLGALVTTWADGNGAATLGSAILSGGTGTAVIVSHGRELANAPFGNGAAPWANQTCSDYYDFFTVGGGGEWTVSIPVDDNTDCNANTLNNNRLYWIPAITTCSGNATPSCWGFPSTITRSSQNLVASGLTVAMLEGTPFVAGESSGGADPTGNTPTAVTLARFEALWQGDAVRVTWETAMELDNLGFNLYRGASPAGPWTRLNAELIPAQHPGAVFGALYEWLDADVTPGAPAYYRLEDVDIHGASTFHGPIQAAPTEPSAVTLIAFGARNPVFGLTLVFPLGWAVWRRRRAR